MTPIERVAAPVPDPQVELLAVGMILEADEGPRLCLGWVGQSRPPVSEGPPVAGWDWGAVDDHESAAGATWGDYAVTGTWDGQVFTLTQPPVPRALHRPVRERRRSLPRKPRPRRSEAELVELQMELHDRRQELGVLSSSVDRGRLWLEVFHDDGTIQRALDEEYVAGVVQVVSALRPVRE